MRTGNKIIFAKSDISDFYPELKKRVMPIITRGQRKAVVLTTIKLVIFPLLFISAYYMLLHFGNSIALLYFFYISLGLLMPLLVLNIVHDAMHKTLYKHSRLNFLARHFLDLVGADSFAWEKRHVHFHHPFTNIPGWDIDLEKKDIFRLSPVDQPKSFFRYQHIYMPFIYPVFTLHWILIRDFKDYFDPHSMLRQKIGVRPIDYIKLVIFKLFYLGYILVIPMLVLPHSWYHYVAGFLILHAFAGTLTLLIVLPNHWDEDASFPYPSSSNGMKESWAMHQLKSTNDFAIYHPFSNFIMGGLNHHVSHHLFPNVNHTLLPSITKELVKISKERNLPYKCFSFFGAIRSHYRLLKKNGYHGNVLEEE